MEPRRRIGVEKAVRGEVTVVSLTGSLDSGTTPQAQRDLDGVLPAGGRLLIDLSRVTFLSSAGLRLLLLLYREARGGGGRFALAGIPVEVRDVMAATGFLDVLLVTDTVDAGLAALA